MVRIVILFITVFSILFTIKINAQENDGEDQIFSVVEDMPEFPGGEDAMISFISENVKYPKEAKKNNIEGKVFVTFVIAKDGSVKNTKVVRGVDPAIDKEALRVINSMPNWAPANDKGEKVNFKYTLPINFVLEEKDQSQNN